MGAVEVPRPVARLPERSSRRRVRQLEHMPEDSDLTPLGELPEFQALLKQRPHREPSALALGSDNVGVRQRRIQNWWRAGLFVSGIEIRQF